MNLLPPISPPIVWVTTGMIIALAMSTGVRFARWRIASNETARENLESLKTWWILVILFAMAMVLGLLACTLLFGISAMLCFREFARLHLKEREDRCLRITGYFSILLVFLSAERNVAAQSFAAVVLFPMIAASCLLIIRGETAGFVKRLGSFSVGYLFIGVGLAHVVRLLQFLEVKNLATGPLGWLLFLVLVTELNDIAQAFVGRRFGKHQEFPKLSPNKTREGFCGGLLFTVAAAILLGHWLTSLDEIRAGLAGMVIAVAGFLGDLTVSGIKRDAGVKDTGHLLPGHGGLLDRLDSLMFTAPAFYYFTLTLGEFLSR